ncbi:MAG: hypothetical protein EXQ70_07030 [Solirubrobacterales bacterium]|nr:hypothetical protein [Solirubrobacterales bacterium]
MRRLLITGFISLLALALVAPAAQALTRPGFAEGTIKGGGQVQLGLTLLTKMQGGKTQPVRMTYFQSYIVPLSCDEGNTFLESGTGELHPGVKLTKGRFSYSYDNVTFGGKVTKQGMKAAGTYEVSSFDVPSSSLSNCSTDGPRKWTAHKCRKGDGKASIPVCRAGGGS